MADKITIQKCRSLLSQVYEHISELNQQICEDHRHTKVCPGFPDYLTVSPGVHIDRAGKRLQKEGYKVAFAGGFSGGKSTLINALLQEPELLPAASGECTLSITQVSAPEAGLDEHVEVTYFNRDDALRNLIENPRYEGVFAEKKADLLRDFTSDKALLAVKGSVKAMSKSFDQSMIERLDELKEFLVALDKFANRLGTMHIDSLANADQYQTTDKNDRGMGHLLLIQQVHLFKKNPMFTTDGIEIVDLPGTDSTNPRQRELTHSFMKDADVVISVLEPKGFKTADVDIQKELGKHHQEIQNKMFFVINMWDKLSRSDITKAEVEKLYTDQIKNKILRAGMNADRIYLTSAKWVELTEKAARVKLSQTERQDLNEFDRGAREKLGGIDFNIVPDLLERMKAVYNDGGVERLRNDLIEYLKEDIERERLRGIHQDLTFVHDVMDKMLDPLRDEVEDILADAKNQLKQVGEFIEKITYSFDEKLRIAEEGLENGIPRLVADAKKKLLAGIRKLTQADNSHLSFRRIRSRLNVKTPKRIKMDAIETMKDLVSVKLVELVEDGVVGRAVAKIAGELDATNMEPILEHFQKQLKRPYMDRYKTLISTLKRDMKMVTIWRATEETWDLRQTEMEPATMEATWTDAIEREFREVLNSTFQEQATELCNNLSGALWRYYKLAMEEAIHTFENLASDLRNTVKHTDVSLPLSLLNAEEGDAESRKLKLAEYVSTHDDVTKWLEPATRFLS